MATGRMLKKNISTSKKLADLKTDQARLLWTWLLPHLDIQGRFSADGNVVKGQIIPRLKTIQIDDIPKYLQDMEDVGLIVVYETKGDKFLQFNRFKDFQILRDGREKDSEIPPPPASTPSQPTEDSVATAHQDKLSKDKISKDAEQKTLVFFYYSNFLLKFNEKLTKEELEKMTEKELRENKKLLKPKILTQDIMALRRVKNEFGLETTKKGIVEFLNTEDAWLIEQCYRFTAFEKWIEKEHFKFRIGKGEK